jgi:hypothetical protein
MCLLLIADAGNKIVVSGGMLLQVPPSPAHNKAAEDIIESSSFKKDLGGGVCT